MRVNYFHDASDADLARMGVDRSKLPARNEWINFYTSDYKRPIEERACVHLLWLYDGAPVGMSSVDRIKYGREARMHLSIFKPQARGKGVGSTAVCASVEFYFSRLNLSRLYCEPNALNEAPNRVLQNAGFRYVRSYRTTPGEINFEHIVTQWEIVR